jgi:hypothetical protein
MRGCGLALGRVSLAVALLVALAAPLRAQGSEQYADAGSGIGVTGVLQWSSPGVGIDFAHRITTFRTLRAINVVGELTFLHSETHNDTDIMGGLRYVRHNTIGKPVLFAQFLAGLNHESREDGGRDDLRLQPGGGAVIALGGDRVFLRVQNDYAIIPMATKTQVYLRFSVGAEIHLK